MAAHKEFKGILPSDKTKIGKYISCATLQFNLENKSYISADHGSDHEK